MTSVASPRLLAYNPHKEVDTRYPALQKPRKKHKLPLMTISCLRPPCIVPCSLLPVSFMGSSSLLQNPQNDSCKIVKDLRCWKERRLGGKKRGGIVCAASLLPVDPWAPSIDSQSIASQLFAFSLFPYIGFLYFITKSKSAPKLTLFGFYFLLAFVGVTSKFLYLCPRPIVLFWCLNVFK